MTDDRKPTQGEAIAAHDEREAVREAGENKPWTWPEVERAKAHAFTDTGDPQENVRRLHEYEALTGSINASAARGDFRPPHEMGAKEYREHAGIPEGQLLIHESDLGHIHEGAGANKYETLNSDAATFWRETLKGAHVQMSERDGRGRPVFGQKGFPGETPEQQVERINTLLKLSAPAISAKVALKKAVADAATLKASAEKSPANSEEHLAVMEARSSNVMGQARTLGNMVRATLATPFDVRGSDEFAAFDRLQAECGGASMAGWKFEDGGE